MSFLSQLSWRYATKKFDDSLVPADRLDAILQAVRMAPTSYGLQPFSVTVVTRDDVGLRSRLQEAAYGKAQIATASHILVFSVRSDMNAVIDEMLKRVSGGDAEVRASLKGLEDMVRGATGRLSQDELVAWASKQAYIALGFALAACAELGVDSCPMEGFDTGAWHSILGLPDTLVTQVALAVGNRAAGEKMPPKVRMAKEEMFTVL